MSDASAPPTTTSRPRRALTGLGALVSLASVAAVLIWALRQDKPDFPSTAPDLGELGAATGLYLLGCAVRGERWLLLLRHNGAERAQRADAYGLVAVTYMGNNVLPARAGDAMRVLLGTPRSGTDTRTVVGTLVAERVLDVLVLLGVFVVLAYGVLGEVETPADGRLTTFALVTAVLLALAVVAAFVLHLRGGLARLVAFLAPMAAATRRLRGRHGAEALAWTLLVWALEWAAWFAVAEAANLGISLLEVGYLLGVASVFVLIPSGPGYAGTFDAGLVFGLRAVGRTGAAALSYVLLLRFVIFIPITVVGLVVLVWRYRGVSGLRSARA